MRGGRWVVGVGRWETGLGEGETDGEVLGEKARKGGVA
jgi:hypothetical protein